MLLVTGFRANRHLFPSGPLEKLWNQFGQLVTNRGPRVEVRHVGSPATADDVVEGRAQLPQIMGKSMPDTLARMLADSLECYEAQVLLNTHLEQFASAIKKRCHRVNLAAHQVVSCLSASSHTHDIVSDAVVAAHRVSDRVCS